LEASGREQETLDEVKQRLERLKAEKEIRGLTDPTRPPTGAEAALARDKEALEKLRVELGIARAEAALAAFDE
jgi:hypothetical protein